MVLKVYKDGKVFRVYKAYKPHKVVRVYKDLEVKALKVYKGGKVFKVYKDLEVKVHKALAVKEPKVHKQRKEQLVVKALKA